MPGEVPKASNRWEGTQTYKKPEATKRRARTVAQLREEAAANSKANRQEAINKRRGSIGGTTPIPSSKNLQSAGKSRRGSTGDLQPTGLVSDTTGAEEVEEEEFFDANDMPGSNKKKRQASGSAGSQANAPQDGNTDAGRTSGVDPEMRALLMSIKTDINESTNAAIERIDRRILANEAAIKRVGESTAEEVQKLRNHVDQASAILEAKIDGKLALRDEAIDKRIEALEARDRRAPTQSSESKSSSRRETAYYRCRKTLKMWPVRGADLVDAAKVFMRQKLRIGDERIRAMGTLEVTQSSAKLARDKAEVLVVFEEWEDRDYVKSTGVNLAGDHQAGMSIHVPGHLLDDLYALNSVGYNIKTSHKGVKRSVKFDDSNMGLYLDICINDKWKRIFPAEAKKALKTATTPSTSDRTLSVDDLSNLIQGEPVAGLTAVVVPQDGSDQEQ